MNVGRLLRTVRYLRARQVAYFAYRRVLQPATKRIRAPSTIERRAAVGLRPRPHPGIPNEGDAGFEFLGVRRPFDLGAADWHDPAISRLWRYNLHYFDYLLDETRSRDGRDRLIDDWIAKNPPGAADAWEPYTASLRIVNWIDYFLRSDDARAPRTAWLNSLYVQAAWLERHIEFHILANHYLKNAVALIFAGAFFAGRQADGWLDRGLTILGEEAREQILSDGGHFERSPMYHAIVTQDLLDVVNILSRSNLAVRFEDLEGLKEKATLALQLLSDVLHPDGEIPLFNDAATGIALHPARLRAYARDVLRAMPFRGREDPALIVKPDTGFYGVRAGDDFLLIDCGPVGPDYQPGHAHCDTLSFELSLNGRRVVVDSGVFGYDTDDLRAYLRSTAAHNTVRINGIDQSEVWGGFRVGRRARPLSASLERRGDDEVAFIGSHDGYRHLEQDVVHERRVMCRPTSGVYEVTDHFRGRGEVRAESFLHLHPDLDLERRDGRFQATEESGRTVMEIVPDDGSACQTEQGVYCPRFGTRLPNTVLAFQKQAVLPFRMSFSLMKVTT